MSQSLRKPTFNQFSLGEEIEVFNKLQSKRRVEADLEMKTTVNAVGQGSAPPQGLFPKLFNNSGEQNVFLSAYSRHASESLMSVD